MKAVPRPFYPLNRPAKLQSLPGGEMADELSTEYLIAIVLGSVLVTLLLVFLCLLCVFLRKKRALCFRRRRGDEERPFVLPDKKLEERYGKRQRRRKRASPPKGAKGKPIKYSRLGQSPALRRPRGDPFAHNYLENPMLDEEGMGEDWTNPVFDSERSRQRDAAICVQSWFRMIRVRIPFLQLRNSVVLCQALYRGRAARKLVPQWKKEKHLKDQQKKKVAGWKKKGTLSALKFYEVKGYGFAEVEQLYGLETMRTAADQLKKLYGGKGKMRLKLFISVKGIKLYDHQTMVHFATVKISSVSFCTLDPKNKKLFAFINRKKRRNFCHVFQCSEHDAQKMVETMAEAFEVTFKQLEQKRQKRMMERSREAKSSQRARKLNRVTKDDVQRQSQELDIEVASMIEMAETASTSSPITSRKQEVTGDIHSSSDQEDSAEETPAISRNKQPPPHRSKQTHRETSGLLTSQTAKQAPKEEFNANDVETYFTDIKKGMEEMSQDLESHSRQATLESKYRRKQKADSVL